MEGNWGQLRAIWGKNPPYSPFLKGGNRGIAEMDNGRQSRAIEECSGAIHRTIFWSRDFSLRV